MANEFNPNPWRKGRYTDKAYPAGTASARPALTPRIHCAVESEESEVMGDLSGKGRCDLFNMQLRAGHGYVNEGEE